MDLPVDRREYLAALGSVATVLSGCSETVENQESASPTQGNQTDPTTPTPTYTSTATPTDTPTETETETETPIPEEWTVDPLEHDKLIGAYYYGWYKGGSGWVGRTKRKPVLGEYSSRDEDVINQQIKWARECGVNTFVYRWGGSDAWDDTTLREHFLEAQLVENINFMVQPAISTWAGDSDYSYGDPIDFDNPQTRERVKDVLRYLDDTFFDRDNHARIGGKPAVTIFGASSFEGDFVTAFQDAKSEISESPYIIADIADELAGVNPPDFSVFDASTTYTLYNGGKVGKLDFDEYSEYVDRKGRLWRIASEYQGLDHVPDVMPGYDPSLLPDDHRPPLNPSPDRFRSFIDSQIENIDPNLKAIFVTSWDEWYEHTSIEPEVVHGEDYLEIVGSDIVNADFTPVDIGERYQLFEVVFNKTVSPGGREIALMLDRLGFNEDGKTLESYNIGVPKKEPWFMDGMFPPEENYEEGPIDTWRWLGGPLGRTAVYVPSTLSSASDATLRGGTPVEGEIEADVYFGGRRTDHVVFDADEPHAYQVSLGGV